MTEYKELNLIDVLKGCPEGTELYSPIFGKVKLLKISVKAAFPILVKLQDKSTRGFTKEGKYGVWDDCECVIFPSKEQKDWTSFYQERQLHDDNKSLSETPYATSEENNEYIDLGLPSGTRWKTQNEEGFYGFDEAVKKYGDSLPTREQFEELKNQCKWEWMGDGYKVTGPNGNTIVLPADGIRDFGDDVYSVGYNGFYWSFTPYGLADACFLIFCSICVEIYDDERCYGMSVRLVKN